MSNRNHTFFDTTYKNIIVSCQALEDEPLHSSEIMAKMAQAAKEGGARAIRCNSAIDTAAIKKQTGLPVVAIVKRDYPDSEVFITPTLKEVKELLEVGVDVIALDATTRKRPNGEAFTDLVKYIHENSDTLVMADVATIQDAEYAVASGADMVSTTLSGYTEDSPKQEGPDFSLVETLANQLQVPVIAEGRINTPEEGKKMLELGAHAIVVGSAITRPQLITKKFVEGII